MQLEWDQTEYVWKIYGVLSVFPNKQNLMTIQSLQDDMEIDHIVHTTVYIMCHGHLVE
jgi:hypothetical protein